MTNLAYNILQIVFLVSAFTVMAFDYKYQKIPYWLLLINYASLCLLIEPILLIGFAYIVICKLEDKPVDFIYLLILVYLILYSENKYFALACIILSLLFVVLNKKEKLSFMIPLELSCIIMLVERMM